MVKKLDTRTVNRQREIFQKIQEFLILSNSRTEWLSAYFTLTVLNRDILGEMLTFLNSLGYRCAITSNDVILSKIIPIKIEGWRITSPCGTSQNFIPPIKKINNIYSIDLLEWCAEIWDELSH